MTQAEKDSISKRFGQHVKLHPMSLKSAPPPSLLDRIHKLDECVFELQQTFDKLEYVMVQHIDMMTELLIIKQSLTIALLAYKRSCLTNFPRSIKNWVILFILGV